MNKLFVCNLSYAIDDAALWELFEPFGEILTAHICSDRETGESRGFGFISFLKESDARRAMQELNGFQVEGRALRVRESQPREQRERSMAQQR